MKLKNKFIYIIFCMLILGVTIFVSKSYAAVSANSPKVETGGTVNITISSSQPVASFKSELLDNGGLTFKSVSSTFGNANPNGSTINGAMASGSASNLATYVFTVPNVTEQKTYSVKFNITGMETESNVAVPNATVTSTVTVTPKPEPVFTTVNQTVYAKSETNVRESFSTTSSSFGMLATGESVIRIGIGDNGWSKVTYNGKTAYIYSNNLTTTKPEEVKSSDKSLKTLTIADGKLEPDFNPETTKYSITVPNNIEKVKIEAVPNSDKAKTTITGNENFVQGTNMVKITVTAEDGTTRIYNLEVVKTSQEPAQLTKLSIPGIKLNPEFNSNIFQYTIQLEPGADVTDFAIQTETNIKDSTVEIIGNSNLKEGENVITILVTSADGKEKSSYQIIVNKPTSEASKNMLGENKNTNIAIISIGILVMSAIVIVVVAIIKKKRAEKEFEDEIDDPYRNNFNKEENNDNINDISENNLEEKDFTGIFKNQISENDEDYVPEIKQEKNLDNMEMTRRYSTNYDYTLEQYKKPKNPGKGKHF